MTVGTSLLPGGKIVVRNERYKSVRAVKGGFKYCESTITIFFYGF